MATRCPKCLGNQGFTWVEEWVDPDGLLCAEPQYEICDLCQGTGEVNLCTEDDLQTQVLHDVRGRLHLIIRRHDQAPVICGWDLIQQVKNKAVGEHVCMVEMFPSTDQVVNEANWRHLWEVEEGAIAPLS